jgi:AcrR family transcriptional regulator
MTALPADEVPVRQRLSADDRRSAIIDAARTLFARNGFRGTGTSDIATAAGCSEPVIYKHFASKQALFAAVLEDSASYMRARFAAAIEGTDDFLDAYVRFVRSLSGDTRAAELHRLRYLAVTLTDEPEILASLKAMVDAWTGSVREAIESAQASGQIRTDVAAESVAMLFFGLAQAAGLISAIQGEGALANFPRHFDVLVELLTPIPGGTV